jgi:hypothetical protein
MYALKALGVPVVHPVPLFAFPSTNPIAMTRHTSPYFSEVLITGVFLSAMVGTGRESGSRWILGLAVPCNIMMERKGGNWRRQSKNGALNQLFTSMVYWPTNDIELRSLW